MWPDIGVRYPIAPWGSSAKPRASKFKFWRGGYPRENQREPRAVAMARCMHPVQLVRSARFLTAAGAKLAQLTSRAHITNMERRVLGMECGAYLLTQGAGATGARKRSQRDRPFEDATRSHAHVRRAMCDVATWPSEICRI